MWTGRQTLASIEGAIAKLHGEEGQLDQALRSAVGDADRLRKERSEGLRELARIKLDEMTAGRLVGNLDAGERRAMQVLDDYRLRMAAVTEQRAALLREVASAEAERHTAAAAVEAALEVVETLRAQAEAKVQTTPEWRAAKARRDEADAVATEAEKKAAASEAELGAKKKPYDGDPLFAYLWQRRFGTAAYSAGNIARAIDRMVAEFIGFSDARPNYAALIEIPLRLREHATAQRATVAEPQAALADIERRAMLELGVDAKEKVLAEARHKLAVVDDTVDKKQGVLRKLDETRKALVAGDGNPAYNEALETIAAADSKDDLAALYAEARRTPTTADEAIVRGLEAIDAKIAAAEVEIAGLRRTAQELSSRRLEVEQVRDRFRTTGYDHPQATFDNNGAIADTLKNILEGVVRSGVLWDLLRQGYGSRPTRGGADFGSPGFPFPFPSPGGKTSGSSGGDWRDPSSRGGWSPGAESAENRSRSDDENFSTGGSF
jgi:chromosome segregation ATPase